MSKGAENKWRQILVLLYAVVTATTVALVVAAAPAMATVVHEHLFDFGNGGAEGATFASLSSLAVDNATSGSARGDVYVALGTGKVIDKYEADGKYICQITGAGAGTTSTQECDQATGGATPSGTVGAWAYGVATDDEGNVYVGSVLESVVNKFSEEGVWLSQISEASYAKYVAVATNGNVYTSTFLGGIERYELKAGGYVKAELASPGEAVEGIAVDDSAGTYAGYLYAAGGKAVHVYNAAGEPEEAITEASGHRFETVTAVAVDPSNGDVYVADGSADAIYELAPGGRTGITQIELAPSAIPQGLIVSGVNGDVYAGNAAGSGQIEVFGPGIVVPNTAITTPAREDVRDTSVTLRGEVEAGGSDVTSCRFEYGETAAYGQSAPCAQSTPYVANEQVSATITGLTPSTQYHFRLSAEDENSGIPAHSEDGVFATSGRAKVVREWAVAGPDDATLNAEAVPYGYDTRCQVQYVAEVQFAISGYEHPKVAPCTPGDLGAGFAPAKAIARIAGLDPNVSYHYRFEVTNEDGAEFGADEMVTTFGVEQFGLAFEGAEREAYSQAGGHPFAMTTKVAFNRSSFDNGVITPSGSVKDVRVRLPLGTSGNPSAVAQCTQRDSEAFQCSPRAEIGVMEVEEAETKNGSEPPHVFVGPLFNLVPPKGIAARFGARFNDAANAYIDATVRSGEGYGIEASSLNITGLKAVARVTVKVWGVPAAASHDIERYCTYPAAEGEARYKSPPCEAELEATPFLTTPTSCGSLSSSVLADAYEAPGDYVSREDPMVPMEGCEKLRFTPSLAVSPQRTSADSPSGVTVDLKLPQYEEPDGLAEADLKDAVVTLPAGVTVNPADANGLVGCPLLTGKDAKQEEAEADGNVSGVNLETKYPGNCPDASKIGTVDLETPLFPHRHFEGGIYIAQQNANPSKSLLAIYVAIDEPVTGVVVKLAGHVEAGGQKGVEGLAPGQLRTTFSDNPQLPFEDMQLRFFGGQRAPLAMPEKCGSYGATASFTSWAEPGTQVAPPIEPFTISSGPGGSACPAAGFAPSLTTGTEVNQGGAYSPFSMTLTRKDGEQRLSSVSMTLPEGLAGTIAKVPLCSEANALANQCSSASQVGHIVAQVGVGDEPDTLPEPGRREDPVYLLGPTEGAPFGLAIVVHPEAGPFNLEEHGLPVIVLAKLEVNPTTAQVTVVSKAMPAMLQGIPVDVKAIHVVIDRSGFMFNPTSCEEMHTTGTVGSQEGASAPVSSRFEAAGCRGLEFKPSFKVLVHAKHNRKTGVYAHFVIKSAFGQANLGSVLVKLPKMLPSRESTLKQACTEEQFAKDPAGCPPGSKVGHATVYTPVLPVPLTGPAIFVSHGGEAYPDLDLVLQGDGVTIIQTGSTHINGKTGVTSSDFKAIPDVPVSRIDLVLPQQSNSALGANGNLCFRTVARKQRMRVRHNGKTTYVTRKVRRKVKRHLSMGTTITGQNGAVIKRQTKVAVAGCRKAKGKGASHKGKHQDKQHQH